MVMQKKGIEPIITTVVLVTFVVASALAVTFWGKGITKELQSKQGGAAAAALTCTGVNFQVTDTAGGSVELDNNGADLSGMLLVVSGSGKTNTVFYNQAVERGSSRSYPYTGIPGVPDVEKIFVVGTVGQGINRPCSDQKLELNL